MLLYCRVIAQPTYQSSGWSFSGVMCQRNEAQLSITRRINFVLHNMCYYQP